MTEIILLLSILNKLLINKKHSAPSAHQNTALSNHASSCQNERVGEKNSRIMSIEQGAASIAPNRGFRTSLRCEKKLATAPGRMKNSKPISGCPAARKAPFMCVARKRHTTMKRTKQQIAPAQRCLCFTRSS